VYIIVCAILYTAYSTVAWFTAAAPQIREEYLSFGVSMSPGDKNVSAPLLSYRPASCVMCHGSLSWTADCGTNTFASTLAIVLSGPSEVCLSQILDPIGYCRCQ
jgi:hypothetical protein